jgi:GT2 family glycosyltransferase
LGLAAKRSASVQADGIAGQDSATTKGVDRQPQPSPRVVAVVLNWNLPADTCACVRSLLASDYPNLSVVVVDNGSSDDSVGILRREWPDLPLVRLPDNLGYAGGNNAGIRQALESGAEYVLLVNNDAFLARDAIDKLVDATNNHVGVAVPRIDVRSTGDLWNAGARRGRIVPLPRLVEERDLAAGQPLSLDFAVGCVLLVRRDVFESVGLLDQRYFAYYEDLDFSSRVRAAGFAIVAIPGARAWHEVGASTRHDTPRRTYLQLRSRTLWCLRQPFGLAGILWWLTLAGHAVRYASLGIRTGERRHAIETLRGLRDGWMDRRQDRFATRNPDPR